MSRLLPIRLGRAPSAFAPTAIAGLKLWLAADRITGLGDGDPAGTWSDLSGQNNHVTQATGSKKPTYKIAIQNGLPVVRFDGSDDFLKATFTWNQPIEVFLVARLLAVPSTNSDFLAGATGDVEFFANQTTGRFSIYAGVVVGSVAGNALGTTNFHVLTGLVNGSSSQTWLDGTSTATGNAGSTAAGGVTLGAYLNGTQALNCEIAEVIGYGATLSSADRQAVEAYLKSKWGTP